MPLEQELATFEAMKPDLLRNHAGKFVLIRAPVDRRLRYVGKRVFRRGSEVWAGTVPGKAGSRN